MSFQKIIFSAYLLTLSSLTSSADLIAGLKFGDNQEEVEKKLTHSPLTDAKINNSLFGRTGLNGAFKTTKKLGDHYYAIYYNWNDDNKLEHLNLHSEHISTTEFNGKLKSSWRHLTNFLSNIHGKATNAADYPAKEKMIMDEMNFTHEWKTDTGYLYMGPGLEKDGFILVMMFTQKSLTSK